MDDLTLHFEAGVWWAESAHHPGWSAAADTLDELFNLIDEAELFLNEAELPL